PGVLDRLGLGWDRLREINPRIVLLSSSLMGQTGPLAHFAGLGNLSTAMSGFASITGWPDGPPTAPFGAYLDYLSPRLGQLALLAAVHDARRTGRGQHLDLSQMEVAMHFLAPALLERQLTGVEPERLGNADPDMVPHGVYACRGQA